ncbi:hypothetical protein ULMS_16350 [Patiriisocius marinistellae]|uniref:Uncharacterized protein n=1 Tax=Patiriisocius marinistellae TaxID=2494560 RepID=A0A5J4FU33_9FLAO|nr:hypothetical protein [Patiriisocius marinistellae]GEQ86127.1 hypothetical protein ULMS_16350 [Patiriisocius marinistellae]
MKFKLLILLIIGITNYGFGQNLNMVIQVNDQLVLNGAFNLHFEYKSGIKERIQIGYEPGELKLTESDWKKISSDSTKNIILTFNYDDFLKVKKQDSYYEIEMEKYHFDNRYLILRVYDFCERKYRRKYSCLTDEDYIYDFNYPQGGILISCG